MTHAAPNSALAAGLSGRSSSSVVPWLIAVSGRHDLYYTLTSVALLSIASAGVWMTFYIGRINIGQGAYALIGGYVSAILVVSYGVSFWLTLPLAGLFCAVVEHPHRRCRSSGCAASISPWSPWSDRGGAALLALAVPITNGAQGHHQHSAARFDPAVRPHAGAGFRDAANPRAAFYFLSARA